MSTHEILRQMRELAQRLEDNMVATYHGESSIDPDYISLWQERIASAQVSLEEAMDGIESAVDLEG